MREKFTFTIKSVTETEKNRAMLARTIHFPLLDDRGLFVIFAVFLSECRIIISKSHINNCTFGSFDIKLKPNLTKDLRMLSLISPTDIDSIAPYIYHNNIMQ